MTLVLHGGPHSDCHFTYEGGAPPEEIRLRGPNVGTTAVYTLTGRKRGIWVYGRCKVTWETPPRLYRFVDYGS